jgi:hypothetical protein
MRIAPISSYAAVMYAALLHLIEALIVATTGVADGSIGVHALLRAIPNHYALAAALCGSSFAAFVVLWRGLRLSPLVSTILLAPQQSFLLCTSIATWLAIWHGSYADGVLRPTLFITADQLPRGMFSLIHLTAIYGIAAYLTKPSR